jgi:Nuclease A inhibitor-like protein
VLRLSEHPLEERCQTLAAAAFFGELAEVEGFPAWYETLKATLTDLKVYRCGAAHLTVSVVGRDAHGRLTGFKTRAVETSPTTTLRRCGGPHRLRSAMVLP